MTTHPGDTADGAPIKLDQVGISHISFTVPDVQSPGRRTYQQGRSAGPAPMDGFTNANGEVSSIFVYDPDGILGAV